jgi:hypothetical protein
VPRRPPWARRLRGIGLPGRRQVSAAAIAVGMLSALAVVFLPVDAAFGDDPILRLRSFDSTSGGPATEVECGTAFEGLRGEGGRVTLYGIARDRACRDAASRRVSASVAAAGIIVVLGLHGLAASSPRLATR